MATITEVRPIENLADFLERLGNVPPERIRMNPPPGTATVKDVIIALEAPRKRICELIDGVLVEKAVGSKESLLGSKLGYWLGIHLDQFDEVPGVILGADGTLELLPHMVRIPDLSYLSWERVGADEWPEEAAPDLVPNLAIEVVSPGNTKGEMTRKLRDYFEAGVEEVWYIYPKTQHIDIYTAPDRRRRIPKDGTLKDSIVFPDFTLSLSKLFASTRRGKKR